MERADHSVNLSLTHRPIGLYASELCWSGHLWGISFGVRFKASSSDKSTFLGQNVKMNYQKI